MSIADQLKLVRDTLNGWAVQNKGKAYVALDMFNLFELLGSKPGGFRVAVHWASETKRGEFEEAGTVDRRFWVGMSWGKSLQGNTGEVLVKGDSGGRPMCDLAEEMRDAIRGIQFDPETTEGYPDYKGMYPLKNIDPGFGVDGIYLEFTIGVQLQPPA